MYVADSLRSLSLSLRTANGSSTQNHMLIGVVYVTIACIMYYMFAKAYVYFFFVAAACLFRRACVFACALFCLPAFVVLNNVFTSCINSLRSTALVLHA